MTGVNAYLVRRLALVIPTVIGVTIVVFGTLRLLPGDAVDQMLGGSYGALTDDDRKELVERYSLDEPVYQQYGKWIGSLVRGDLGKSVVTGRSVKSELPERIVVSAELGLFAVMIATIVGVPSGVISAVHQNGFVDHIIRSSAVLFLALPSFWLALLTIGYGFEWFGWTPPLRYEQLWDKPAQNLKIITVPGVILAGHIAGITMRFARSTMLESLREDFVRTARAKGLRERSVVTRHALRAAAAPVITVIALQVPVVIGGSVILEQIFSLPGTGRMLLDGIRLRDYPVVQAIVLLSAALVIVVNLAVDILNMRLDPRISS